MTHQSATISVDVPVWLHRFLRSVKRSMVGARTYVGEKSLNIWGDRDVEYSWIGSHLPCGPGEALDFGSGTSYLALLCALRGFDVTALDLRSIDRHYAHPALHFVQGDVFTVHLPAGHFDIIINCSSIEHVGLAGRYGVVDQQPDGDLVAMRRLLDLMKPGALMLLTIPVGQDSVFMPVHRVYGVERLPRLLDGFEVQKEMFWVKDSENRWIVSDKEAALQFQASGASSDPSLVIYGLGCFVLRKGSFRYTNKISYP